MSAERSYGLAPPVVLLQEGVDWHRHVAPPVGITDENHIIILNSDIIFDGRTSFTSLFLLGYLHNRIIGIMRIIIFRNNLKQRATGHLSYHFCYDMGITLRYVTDTIVFTGMGEKNHENLFVCQCFVHNTVICCVFTFIFRC